MASDGDGIGLAVGLGAADGDWVAVGRLLGWFGDEQAASATMTAARA
jgi:hypothetical protein